MTEEDFTAAIRPKDLLSGGVSRSEEKHKDLFEDLSEGNQEPPSEISPVRNSGKTQVLMGLGGISDFAKYTQQDVPSSGELQQNLVNRNFEDLHKDLLQEDELLSVFRSLEQADRDAVLDMARRLRRR